jgi:hypothetical protein
VTRAGRDLELLVARLETAVAPYPVEVVSPDYILGRESQSLREVDVAMRSTAGSVALLVIFECRDRGGAQDVRWIEELDSKGRDVGADKVVAVSSAGFTSGARRLAASRSIELRTVESITASDVVDWISLSSLTVALPTFEGLDADIELFSDTPSLAPATELALQNSDIHGLSFTRLSDGLRLTVDELAWQAVGVAPLHLMDEAASQAPQRVRLRVSDMPPLFGVDTVEGVFPVRHLVLATTYSVETFEALASRTRRYVIDDESTVEVVEFDVHALDRDVVVGIWKQGDSMCAGVIAPEMPGDQLVVKLSLELA